MQGVFFSGRYLSCKNVIGFKLLLCIKLQLTLVFKAVNADITEVMHVV